MTVSNDSTVMVTDGNTPHTDGKLKNSTKLRLEGREEDGENKWKDVKVS